MNVVTFSLARIRPHIILSRYRFGGVSITRSSIREFRSRPVVDPGIGRRRKLLNEHDNEKDASLEEEDFEDVEGMDLMNVDQAYPLHKKELQHRKEWVERKIEYSRNLAGPKPPNMLHWVERLQIKELHKKDPEEWNIDVLADTFPATREIIQKILKSKWVPKNLEEMKKFDEKVRNNWKLLEEGKLEIDGELLEHLKKFIPRREDYLKNLEIDDKQYKLLLEGGKPQEAKQTWNKGEMLGILTSYEKALNNRANVKEMPDKSAEASIKGQSSRMQKELINNKEVKLLSQKIKPRRKEESTKGIRKTMDLELNLRIAHIAGYGEEKLRELEEKIKNMNREVDKNNYKNDVNKIVKEMPSVSERVHFSSKMDEKLIEDNNEPLDTSISQKINLSNNIIEKLPEEAKQSSRLVETSDASEKDKLTLAEEKAVAGTFFWESKELQTQNNVKDNKILYYNYGYPERIEIPEEQRNNGSLFRVKDCFYDNDGEFLYRVPGFVNVTNENSSN